jgi:hypothetical protein
MNLKKDVVEATALATQTESVSTLVSAVTAALESSVQTTTGGKSLYTPNLLSRASLEPGSYAAHIAKKPRLDLPNQSHTFGPPRQLPVQVISKYTPTNGVKDSGLDAVTSVVHGA